MRGKKFLLNFTYNYVINPLITVMSSFNGKYLFLTWMVCLLCIHGLFAQAPVTGIKANGKIMNAGDTINICIGNTIFYESLAQNGTINWQFQSSTTPTATGSGPFNILYNKAGIDTTFQTVFSGLDTVRMFILIKVNDQKPTAQFNFIQTDSCGNIPVTFNSNASVGNPTLSSYKWTFGDGGTATTPNPSYQFLSATGVSGFLSYNVKLAVTNSLNCKDSISKIVNVKKIPDAALNNPDNLVGYYPYNGVQTFARCTNSPTYLFSFRNASTTASINTKYVINWGDGNPDSTVTNFPKGAIITHLYTIGQHTLTVTVTGSTGCIGIKKYNIFLGTTPAGGFATPGNNDICAPGGLNFIISGYNNNTIGTTYSIFVNDGSDAITFNHPPPDTVTHFFGNTSCGSTASTYQNSFSATLIIANPCLTTSVDVKPIFVSTKPKPSMGIYPSQYVCKNATVSFFNNSAGGNTVSSAGNITQCTNTGKQVWTITPATGYNVTFGTLGSTNGSPDNTNVWTNGSNFINIQFLVSGTYTIRMQTGTDRCGTQEIVRTICVRNPPQASFTMDKKFSCGIDTAYITNTSPSGGCLGDTYNWTVTHTDPAGCNTFNGIDYKFVNGTLGVSKNPNIQFLKTGRYIITLTVNAVNTSFTCAPGVYSDTFYVKAKPKVNINPINTVCIGNTISPTASVTNCYGTVPLQYLWTFNSGTPDSAFTLNPGTIAYNSIGNHRIILDVTNECGITSDTSTAIITSTPTAKAGADVSVCSGISAKIGEPAAGGFTYQWSPATGLNSSTVANPTVTRTYAGPSSDTTFRYVLTISAGVNCSGTDTVYVTVKKNPVVIVSPLTAQACVGTPQQLTVSGADNYAWSPGNGLNTNVGDMVIATPTSTTTYSVTGTSANGCTASASATVNITQYVTVDAGADTLVCNSTNAVTLTGSPFGGNWSGNNFISPAGIFNPSAAGNGVYKVKYTAGPGACTTTDSLLITVTDIPVAFAGNDTSTCEQAGTLQLIGLPTGGKWSGSSQVSNTGLFSTSKPGNYILIYTIGGGTCIGRDTIRITVSGGIINNNISTDQSICTGTVPNNINGSVAGGGSGSTIYQWQQSLNNSSWSDILGANGTSYQPPALTDTIWYRRIATTILCNGPQASTSNVVRIIVHQNATALFNPTSSIGCVPFNITSQVINHTPDDVNIKEYRWFVDGRLVGNNQAFPGYVMNTPGDTSTIKLVAISRFGCINDSMEHGFKTIVRPVPSYTKSNSIGCGPLVITFTNTTPNAGLYKFQWDFGQGQTNQQIQPAPVTFPVNPAGGDTTYTVTMKVLSACDTIPVTTLIVVRGKPRVLFSPDRTVGCSPMPVTFTNTSKGTSANFTWKFGDGSAPLITNDSVVKHTFTTGVRNTFYVKLYGGNDCGNDSTVYNIIVNPNSIKSNFSVNGNERFGCAPHTVQFINNTIGANTFTWNFGDGSPTIVTTKGIDTLTHIYASPGTYNTTLFSSNSCNDTTDMEMVTVGAKPLVSFTANPLIACVSDTINFTNKSDTAIANNWKFGDNTQSSGRNPIKVYNAPGIYRVTLYGTRAFPQGFGCIDSSFISIQIRDTIPGHMKVSDSVGLCLPFTATFKNNDGPATFTNWNFGDGTSVTGDSVVHTFTKEGVFAVSMISKVSGGCIYKSVTNITVTSPSGVLDFKGGYLCPGTPLRLEVKNGNATQYRYVFGDGDTLLTNNTVVFHEYKQAGTYIPFVYLLRGNCVIKITHPDTVKVDAVSIGFTVQQTYNCGSTKISFTDTSHAFFGITNWQWNFGDGTTSNLQNPSKSISVSGTYFNKLTVTGKSGCMDTITLPINVVVHNVPSAEVGSDSLACTRQALPVQALVISKDSIANVSWNFGNNTTASGLSAVAVYNIPGTYTIRLIVNTIYGCADTVYKTISVRPSPLVTAGTDARICKGNTVQLNAIGANTWLWSPLQSLSCTNCNNPVANPPTSTQYVVAGTNTFGCTNYDTVVVEVIQPFTLNVTGVDTICTGQSTQLFATGATKYLWNPVAGLSNGTVANPIANPSVTTRYQVIGGDAYKCFADTAYINVAVGKYPTVNIGTGGVVVAGTQVPFAPVLTNGPFKNYTWTPSTDLSCPNCANPIATINTNIIYKLDVENIFGCKASDTIQYQVRCEEALQVFIPTGFSPDGDGINDILMVRGKGLASVKYLRIFNRWGQLVFERENVKANDPSGGWDGRIKGILADPDVYVFTAELVCTAGGTFVQKGNITLVR